MSGEESHNAKRKREENSWKGSSESSNSIGNQTVSPFETNIPDFTLPPPDPRLSYIHSESEISKILQLEGKVKELEEKLNSVTKERDHLNKEVGRLGGNLKVVSNQFRSFLEQVERAETETLREDTTHDDSMDEIAVTDNNSSISNPIPIDPNSVDMPSNFVGKSTTNSRLEYNFLTKLSGELILQIFGYLSKRDILEMASACKEWTEIIYNTPHLWRRLEWRDICATKRNLESILEMLNTLYYFRWLHELDFGFKSQKSVTIEEAHHFHSKEIQKLSKCLSVRCKWIRVFKICAARLYDATMKSVVNSCPNVEYLCFESGKKTLFTDHGLGYLVSLENLKGVSLPSSEHYSDRGISRLIKKQGESMTSFEFYFLPGIHQTFTDNAVKFISQYCPNLTAITIHGHGGLTEKSLEYLSKGCIHLTSIDLSRSPSLLTEISLSNIASSCRLEVVNLSNCLLNDAKLTSFAKHSHGTLRKLNISKNPSLTDDSIDKLALNSPKLKELKISLCLLISNTSAMSIKDHCPEIKLVDAKGTLMTEDAWDSLECVEL
eukprot:TRINITY_DN4151_c0_g1_i1.p1 TRINITY_DN4151_c0_g1~~TRINITY_DN4151_c0_g1_i1.p1  ORF type:complete len:550 (-),score=151.35 TRINITY_DN4151_c0_g1_i1:542-2191(-)